MLGKLHLQRREATPLSARPSPAICSSRCPGYNIASPDLSLLPPPQPPRPGTHWPCTTQVALCSPRPHSLLRVPRRHPGPPDLRLRQHGSPHVSEEFGRARPNPRERVPLSWRHCASADAREILPGTTSCVSRPGTGAGVAPWPPSCWGSLNPWRCPAASQPVWVAGEAGPKGLVGMWWVHPNP